MGLAFGNLRKGTTTKGNGSKTDKTVKGTSSTLGVPSIGDNLETF